MRMRMKAWKAIESIRGYDWWDIDELKFSFREELDPAILTVKGLECFTKSLFEFLHIDREVKRVLIEIDQKSAKRSGIVGIRFILEPLR